MDDHVPEYLSDCEACGGQGYIAAVRGGLRQRLVCVRSSVIGKSTREI